MLFALVILGVYMGWLEAVYGKRPTTHPDSGAQASRDEDASPPIPEFYLRPELIPIKERDDTPKIADRFVRSRHG